MCCGMPGFPILHYVLEFAQTHVCWVNDAIQPSHPLSSPPFSSIFPGIRVFSNESTLRIRWSKYWSFSFSVSPSNEYSGLTSFRIDWFHLLAVQGLIRVFSRTTAWNHQFFSTQPSLWSNSHIHTWLLEKSVLTTQTFVSKVMSLLFNMLSRFVIAFLPRSKHLLILWLQSPSTVILEPSKIKSIPASTFSPSICHEVNGTRCFIILQIIHCYP